jgi:hypothetical protein
MELGNWAQAIAPSMQQDVQDRAELAEKLGRGRFAAVVFQAAEELVESDQFWNMATALIAGDIAFGAPTEASMSGPEGFKITIKIESP